MKILFLTPYPIEGPSTRHRVFQFLPYLNEANIGYELESFLTSNDYSKVFLQKATFLLKVFIYLKSFLRRLLLILSENHTYDIIFIQLNVSPIFSNFFNRIILASKSKIIFDFDDAQHIRHSNAQTIIADFFRNINQTKFILEKSDLAIVGNDFLKEFAEQYCKEVIVIPTTIETRNVETRTYIQSEKVILGWMGSSASSRYLDIVKDVFLQLLQANNNLEIQIVGSKGFKLRHQRINFMPWQLHSEYDLLRRFDIGIMPLADDEYSKGKCGFKALQYMIVGTPVVVSPVGVNKQIVQHGINGYHAYVENDWIGYIQKLIDNHLMRIEMGQKGRKFVISKYSTSVYAPNFISSINKIAKIPK
ncbi:MAG: glycosyltransferase family 1 protein [Calditrichaeota bacterium]|nr:MAG: glycosyltransferase family 1 protein [Calditrichota bacterium]